MRTAQIFPAIPPVGWPRRAASIYGRDLSGWAAAGARRLVAAATELAGDLAARMEARATPGRRLGRPLASESVDAFHVTIEIPECALDVNVIPRRMGATVFVLLRSDSGKRGWAAEAARYQITPRSIRLPAAADLTEVTTRLANGFLTVTAPRRATATSRAE